MVLVLMLLLYDFSVVSGFGLCGGCFVSGFVTLCSFRGCLPGVVD